MNASGSLVITVLLQRAYGLEDRPLPSWLSTPTLTVISQYVKCRKNPPSSFREVVEALPVDAAIECYIEANKKTVEIWERAFFFIVAFIVLFLTIGLMTLLVVHSDLKPEPLGFNEEIEY